MFSVASKLDMATRGKQFFDKKICIPAGDTALRGDLHSLRCIPSIGGAPRFVVDGDGESRADRTWALFLALRAADCGLATYAHHGVPRHRNNNNKDRPNNSDDLKLSRHTKTGIRSGEVSSPRGVYR